MPIETLDDQLRLEISCLRDNLFDLEEKVATTDINGDNTVAIIKAVAGLNGTISLILHNRID